SALTATSHRFIAQKATAGMGLDETNLFKGATDPDNNALYSDNPEFVPANHYCYKNTECPAIKWSEEYRRRSLSETDKQKRAYYAGIAINFYSDSIVRSQHVGNDCYSQFERQIEEKIKQPTPSWETIQQCAGENEIDIITLRYSEKDLNQTITLTKKYINPTEAPPLDANALKPTDEQLLSIVSRLADQNLATEDEFKLAVRLLVEMENFTCFQSAERKNELYEKWKGLDQIGKSCLEYFSVLDGTNPSFFIQQCPNLPKDISGATMAQITLDQYYKAGFSEIRTFQIQQPTTVLDAGGKITTSVNSINFIEYVPKKIRGCTVEFEQREEGESTAQDKGVFIGIGAAFIIAIILWALTMIFLKGE
ncbi:MAG: hypothetical protein UX13_C0006G0001, partial [Candidatus Woesebacteria bacterium GW2011_GWB1_45_5]